ncbi:MAG: class I SAM-dependent methyltransferase [Betaproteobacteria bacterium]|nr:MAG: class I SAM-dependent methyltransferase [Betaproteobacteria bacterium]
MAPDNSIAPTHGFVGSAVASLPVPTYLQEIYWWAYVHPWAVRVFEREWLVNMILLGNYARLRDAALAEIGCPAAGRTLQIACVYGDLTVRLNDQIAGNGALDVVDVMPIQLRNLHRKLPAGAKARLVHGDSTALEFADAAYDQVLLFFLLHEQPLAVRRRTLTEAIRVVKPGGKVVLVDYHRPHRWHPLKPAMRAVLRRLEPFALDLWDCELEQYLPDGSPPANVHKETYFGGLYQKVVITR